MGERGKGRMTDPVMQTKASVSDEVINVIRTWI